MLEAYKKLLKENGMVEIDLSLFPETDLLSMSSNFGEVIPGARGELVQEIPAREKGNGPVGSFSYTVGYGAFPWHTDTAYWNVPARYLLLTSSEESPCATLYQSFATLRRLIPDFDYLMSRAVFLLDVPGMKHYISPCIKRGNDVVGYRLDFHIYKPANEEARRLTEYVANELSAYYERQQWTGKNAVIIDNWRFIHSRENAECDKNRVLKRIYINELD